MRHHCIFYIALLYHCTITYYTTVLLFMLRILYTTLLYTAQLYIHIDFYVFWMVVYCILKCSILYMAQRHTVLLQYSIDVLLYYRIIRFYCTIAWHIAIIFYYCIPTTEFSYSLVYYCTIVHCILPATPLRLCASASAPRTPIHRRVLCDAPRHIVWEGVRLYVCRSMIDWQCMMGASSWPCIPCISIHLEGWILFPINSL